VYVNIGGGLSNMRASAAFLGFCTVIGWVQSAGTARACSCTTADDAILLPLEGDLVPRNARIWLRLASNYTPPSLELLSPGEESIPFDMEEIPIPGNLTEVGRVLVATPREPLAPGKGYVFKLPTSEPYTVTFEVIDEVDTTAPSVPEIDEAVPIIGAGQGSSCGSTDGYDLFLDAEGVVFSLYAATDELDEDRPGGRAHDATTFDPEREGTVFSYGGACGPRWPGGETIRLRFASYDIAGNFSGMSEPQSFKRPHDGGCSVSTHPRSPRPNAALALLALALAARRLRSSRSRSLTRST
jgi:MYXO-CTERM domain-containing protein